MKMDKEDWISLGIQFAKFGVVGGICFALDWGLMVLFTEKTPMGYFRATALAFAVSSVLNYILSMRYVYEPKEGRRRRREFIIFVILAAIGLVFNQVIMWLEVEFLGIFYALAKVFSAIIVSIYNFFSRKAFLEA
ncbi:MAG: GtrA family protein [Clostridiales bacterium]|nr:GtrA family protein [Clostridiales bacterium]